MAIARDSAGQEISEQFTLRANGRAVTVDAWVDSDASRTQIAAPVLAALAFDVGAPSNAGPSDRAAVPGPIHPCLVAWTDYESQGFRSLLDVGWAPGPAPTVVGADFLDRHRLRVDAEHGGLVGWAPPNATPLTGGGYVVDAAPGEVLELNGMRFDAAQPGQILRPHPAWRFTVPAGIKMRPAVPAPAAEGPRTDAAPDRAGEDARPADPGRPSARRTGRSWLAGRYVPRRSAPRRPTATTCSNSTSPPSPTRPG